MVHQFFYKKDMSLTCCMSSVGNVPDMTSGWGHVLKSQGQNSMAGHVLCIFSYMSPWCPDSQSHVLSSNWNQKIVNQPNIPNLDLEV